MEEKKSTQYNDIDGKSSSKRTSGILYLKAALYLVLVHYVISIIHAIFVGKETLPFPTEEWYGLIFVGSGLLGITLAERFRPLAGKESK